MNANLKMGTASSATSVRTGGTFPRGEGFYEEGYKGKGLFQSGEGGDIHPGSD